MSDNEFDIMQFSKISPERVLELLKGSTEKNSVDDYYEHIRFIKKTILEDKTLTLNDENVLGDIEILYNMLPQNITAKEKVRWMYMGLGCLFSYDYRVVEDSKYSKDKVVDVNTYIGRYQTCIQISDIVKEYLNRLDNVECNVINRSLGNIRGEYGDGHVANEVIITDDEGNKEKYLLDLTLDLYLIQSGCRTEHFGYESGINGEYDIIPQIDVAAIDEKFSFIRDEGYTDEIIKNVKQELKQKDYSNMITDEIIDYRIDKIESLSKMFAGYHEGKRYTNKLFNDLLGMSYKEFNLYSNKDSDINLKTCYLIEYGDYQRWLIYSNRLGFMETNLDGIKRLLDDGWRTKSPTLKEKVYEKENINQNKTV